MALQRTQIIVPSYFIFLFSIDIARNQTYKAINKELHRRYLSVRHCGMSQGFKILEINLFLDNL